MSTLLDLSSCISDSEIAIDAILGNLRNFQVHEINMQREVFGEYHHLFPVLKNYEDKFYKYMRMMTDTFNYILSKANIVLKKNWCNFHRQPIQPEERLVVTIRFLATGSNYSDLAFSFRMGESTICTIIKETAEFLWNTFYVVHMPLPTVTDFQRIANEFFKKWNFPHCVGAIDGCHVAIKKPAKSGSKYFNYKKFHSIVLQAVVDANYKFIVIDVGGYGSQHDAETFAVSTLYSALKEGEIKLPQEDALPHSEIILPYYLVGDGAYPLKNFLMKPFPGKNLPADEEKFNRRLSRARMVVECAFGIMYQKWQIFNKSMPQTPDTVELVVKAACILHNIIIDYEGLQYNDILFQAQDEDVEEAAVEIECETQIDTTVNLCSIDNNFGKEIRDELKKYIMCNP